MVEIFEKILCIMVVVISSDTRAAVTSDSLMHDEHLRLFGFFADGGKTQVLLHQPWQTLSL